MTQEDFWQWLPQILQDISEATFVAIDLEMSGISTKTQAPTNLNPSTSDAYLKLRDAAKNYQILQVGLTCARLEDDEASAHGEAGVRYVTQTYNFHLTPLFPISSNFDRTIARTVDRKVSFSLNSLQFLEGSGFDMNKSFAKGIPYLSRLENCELRTQHCVQHHLQFRKNKNGGVKLEDLSTEARKFHKDHHKLILDWAKREEVRQHELFLDLTPG